MPHSCSICTKAAIHPVSVPCGHVFCSKCLEAHVQGGNNITESACPVCLKTFALVTPNFDFVLEKYQQFFVPPIRKVIFDDSLYVNLLESSQKIEQENLELAAANQALETEKTNLKTAIADLTEDNRKFVTSLRVDNERLKTNHMESKIAFREQVACLESRNATLATEIKDLRTANSRHERDTLKLQKDNANLKGANAALEEDNSSLDEVNTDLEAAHSDSMDQREEQVLSPNCEASHPRPNGPHKQYSSKYLHKDLLVPVYPSPLKIVFYPGQKKPPPDPAPLPMGPPCKRVKTSDSNQTIRKVCTLPSPMEETSP